MTPMERAAADFSSVFHPVVVSLARTPDRLALFRAENAATGIEFQVFEAVDGRDVSTAEAVAMGVLAEGVTHYTPGLIGNAMSHRRLWREVVETGRPRAIFEDDVVLRRDLAPAVMAVAAQFKLPFDLLFLGYNTDGLIDFAMPDGRRMLAAFEQKEMYPDLAFARSFAQARTPFDIFRVHHVFGMGAYIVTPRGAKRCLTAAFPLDGRSVRLGRTGSVMRVYSIDSMLNDNFGKLDAFAFYPPIALPINDHGASTTLQGYNATIGPAG